MQFRGGSSKGLFFNAKDLPADITERDKIILAAMEGVGHGDPRQIDGLGGATSLTSKVAIISLSANHQQTLTKSLDYLFLQVVIGKGKITTSQTCGNILAGVVPFAIESGMIPATMPTTSAEVQIINTGGTCEITIQTPNGYVEYAGLTKVDGVPGTAAPIICNYLNIEGATCGALFPTGNLTDFVDGIEVTCIDNGMPEVLIRAEDLNISGYESPIELDANEILKKKLESIRLQIGPKMNLGDVYEKTIPKMCIISLPKEGGIINTRTFIPHVCHEAIGVLGAVSTATACVIEGTIANKMLGIGHRTLETKQFPASKFQNLISELSVEHPSGEFTVNLEIEKDEAGQVKIKNAGVIRTARLLSKGEVFIPNFL